MVHGLLIKNCIKHDVGSKLMTRDMRLAGVIDESVQVFFSVLLKLEGIGTDSVERLLSTIGRDSTVEARLWEFSDRETQSCVILAPRNGTFHPATDLVYKLMLFNDPDVYDRLKVKEYAVFYAVGTASSKTLKNIEEYVIKTGEYCRLPSNEIWSKRLHEAHKSAELGVLPKKPSLDAKENPQISEPFSTMRLRMVMDRYRNIPPDEMRLKENLVARSGDACKCISVDYTEFLNQLGKQDITMSAEDARAVHTFFRSEGRDPTEMELRIISRCRSERWAHPTVYTSISVSEYNDETVEEVIEEFRENCAKLGIDAANATLFDVLNAPLKAFCANTEGQRDTVRAVDPESIVPISDGNNGLRIETDDGVRTLAFTMESNNTKTSVDPAGGATACLGISLRRALGAGGYPCDVVRLSGIASPYVSDETDGKAANVAVEQRRLAISSLDGFSEYARAVGVPCSANFEYISDRFESKHMEVSATVSVSEAEKRATAPLSGYEEEKQREKSERRAAEKAVRAGDAIIIFGSRTGRDGRVYRKHLKHRYGIISDALEKQSSDAINKAKADVIPGNTVIASEDGGEEDVSSAFRTRAELVDTESFILGNGEELFGEAVPGGEALIQRKLMRLCSDPFFKKDVKRLRDVDSSGIVTAVTTLSEGAEIYLDCVPVKYNGMFDSDVAFSETCERMVAVVEVNKVGSVIELCSSYGLICAQIGTVTDNGYLSVFGCGVRIAHLPVKFLMNGGNGRCIIAKVNEPEPLAPSAVLETALLPLRRSGALNRLIHRPTADHISAYRMIAAECRIKTEARMRRFDNTVFENAGISHMTREFAPVSVSYIRDAHGIVKKDGERLCSAVTVGMHADICASDPYKGAYCAVTDALSRLIACGVRRNNAYAALHLFHPAYRSYEEQNGDALAAVAGIYDAQSRLGCPIICGDFSLGGDADGRYKPAVAAFGIAVGKEKEFRSCGFKRAGSKLCLFKPALGRNGLPVAESQIEVYNRVEALFAADRVVSAISLTGMSLAEGVAYMCYGSEGKLGFEFDASCNPEEIYGTLYGAIAVELEDTVDIHRDAIYGTVTDDYAITAVYRKAEKESAEEYAAEEGSGEIKFGDGKVSISVEYLKNISRARISTVYENKPYGEIEASREVSGRKLSVSERSFDSAVRCSYASASPQITVVRFNSDVGAEMLVGALKKASAGCEIVIKEHWCGFDAESAEGLAKKIEGSEMLCLPDISESPMLLAELLRHPSVEKAIAALRTRKGLIYGCGGAFSALIQAGYLGRNGEDAPINGIAVARNPLSGLTRRPALVRVFSKSTPFVCSAEMGGVYRTEISSYNGRLVGDHDQLTAAGVDGKIVTVYAGGAQSHEKPYSVYNSCESVFDVDSMTDGEGLIFGQLSFPERAAYPTGMEYDGYEPLPVFRSAVDYLLGKLAEAGS